MIPPAFHFLRPEWLLALVPAALLALAAWRRLGVGSHAWARLVDAHLLRHLALSEDRRAHRWPVLALLAGWVLASVAMAGPAWHRLPSPTLERRDPAVVVLSLGQSMDAADQSPTRLGAARHKVEDIIARMRGGQVGLVIFADRPFVASPLTEDGRVVAQMLPELATDLMPVPENRPDLALQRAVELMQGAGAPAGRIVLLTDGPGDLPERTASAAAAAARAGFEVSVIGLGGGGSAPATGTAASMPMDAAGLARLAAAGGGAFSPATADGADLERIFSAALGRPGDFLEKSGLTADQWADMGPWLLIGVLLLAPLAFRRGWIAVLLLAALPATAPLTRAAAADLVTAQGWRNLWQTPDQQGASAFAREDFEAARRSFQDPAWRAGALYRAGDYEAAATAFGQLPGADYNRGNALARAGRLEEAIKAYDAALGADPNNQDAAYNRNLVQKLLDKKKDDEQKKSDQGGTGNQNNSAGSGKESSGGGGQGGTDQSPKDGAPPSADKGAPGQPDPSRGADTARAGPDPKSQDPRPQAPPKPPEQKSSGQTPGEPKPSGPVPPEPKPPAAQAGAQPPSPAAPSPAAPGPPVAGQPGTRPPGDEGAAAAARRAKADAEQTREQLLRLVPDDAAGLLRARIRSHYDSAAAPGPGVP